MTDKPVTEPAEGSPAEASGDAIEREAALQRERDEFYDRLLRKTAEFDNYRKRIERERREHADEAITSLLREILLVVDDFDRALTAELPGSGGSGPGDETAAAYRKGVELIHAKLHEVLRKYGVRPFDAVGADFDPNLHQAVIHEVSAEHHEGQVIDELQRGYLIGERLLRPAMVKVAKA